MSVADGETGPCHDTRPPKGDVTRDMRAAMKGQRPRLLWLTGLSGAGKSTIANLVERKLHALGRHTYLLDGDNLRHGLNRDRGFSVADRVENLLRAAECAALLVDSGLIVIAAFISPFRAQREAARALVAEGEFVEIFIDTALSVCEARDPKGLYRRARAGLLPDFTGIDSPYEPPEAPELRIDGNGLSAEDAADRILAFMGVPVLSTVIETERLILRRFHPVDDVAAFQRIYGDPVTMAHMNGAKTADAARLSVERKAAKWDSQGYGLWCVIDKASGLAIGHCGLDLLEPLGEVECAYLIDRPFWGRGLATEAVKAAIAFGFDRLGLTRIIAISEPENPASMAVMAKAGMTQEGPVTVWGRPFIRWGISPR